MKRNDRYPAPIRRFVFDGVHLLPARRLNIQRGWVFIEETDDWALPDVVIDRTLGVVERRRTATTQELFNLARRIGVNAFLFVRKEEVAT